MARSKGKTPQAPAGQDRRGGRLTPSWVIASRAGLVGVLIVLAVAPWSEASHNGGGCASFVGTNGDDFYFGNDGCEDIEMRAGPDIAFGEGGRDDVMMGDGNDSGEGGGDADFVFGGRRKRLHRR